MPDFGAVNAATNDRITQKLKLELELDAAKASKGIDEIKKRVDGGKGSSGGGGGGGGISGFVGGAANALGSSVFGQAGIGAGLNYVANYGLTKLGQIPGFKSISDTLIGAGSVFNGTSNAAQEFLGINERFNRSGVALGQDVQKTLAQRLLAQQSFVQNQQNVSKEIFDQQTSNGNGIQSDKLDAGLDDITKSLQESAEAIRNAFRGLGIGDTKR